MRDDRRTTRDDDILDPEDVNSAPTTPLAAGGSARDASAIESAAGSSNGADAVDIPVPIAMSAAEIDERARAVEAVRRRGRDDSTGMR